MTEKSILRLDWATHEAALYACKTWHYSKSIPVPPLVKIGVWEYEKFIGVVIFSRGASPKLLNPYGLTQDQGAELSRVSLNKHVTPVTRIIKIALVLLKTLSPNLRLIVSFADTEQGHHGGIYQGGNWIYTGTTAKSTQYLLNGKKLHSRQVSSSGVRKQFGEVRKVLRHDQLTAKQCKGKHRYILPLDVEMKKIVLGLSVKYPKKTN